MRKVKVRQTRRRSTRRPLRCITTSSESGDAWGPITGDYTCATTEALHQDDFGWDDDLQTWQTLCTAAVRDCEPTPGRICVERDFWCEAVDAWSEYVGWCGMRAAAAWDYGSLTPVVKTMRLARIDARACAARGPSAATARARRQFTTSAPRRSSSLRSDSNSRIMIARPQEKDPRKVKTLLVASWPQFTIAQVSPPKKKAIEPQFAIVQVPPRAY